MWRKSKHTAQTKLSPVTTILDIWQTAEGPPSAGSPFLTLLYNHERFVPPDHYGEITADMKLWIFGPIPLLNHSVLKVKQSHGIILCPRHNFLRFCCIRTHFVCKEQDNSVEQVVARGAPGRYWKIGGVGGWRGHFITQMGGKKNQKKITPKTCCELFIFIEKESKKVKSKNP